MSLPQMTTVLRKPATTLLMRTSPWGTWRLSAGILRPECGSPTGRRSLLCPAPPWPPTAAGAACWEPGRWCWLRHLFCTSWAEVSGMMVPQRSYSGKKQQQLCNDLTRSVKSVDKKCLILLNLKSQLEHVVVWSSGSPTWGLWEINLRGDELINGMGEHIKYIFLHKMMLILSGFTQIISHFLWNTSCFGISGL